MSEEIAEPGDVPDDIGRVAPGATSRLGAKSRDPTPCRFRVERTGAVDDPPETRDAEMSSRFFGAVCRGAWNIANTNQCRVWDIGATTVEVEEEIVGANQPLDQIEQGIGKTPTRGSGCLAGKDTRQVKTVDVKRCDPRPRFVRERVGNGNRDKGSRHRRGVEVGKDLPNRFHPLVFIPVDTGNNQQSTARIGTARDHRREGDGPNQVVEQVEEQALLAIGRNRLTRELGYRHAVHL